MKRNLILLFITITLLGCRPSEEPSAEVISSMVFPDNLVDVRKRLLAVQDLPENALESIIQSIELHHSNSREVLTDVLQREFSPVELRELQDIYESEVMVKLQMILSSYDFHLGVHDLHKTRIDQIRSEPDAGGNGE